LRQRAAPCASASAPPAWAPCSSSSSGSVRHRVQVLQLRQRGHRVRAPLAAASGVMDTSPQSISHALGQRGQRTVRFDLRRGSARPTTALQEGLCPLARVRSRDDNPPERGQRTVRFDLRRGFARPTMTLQEGLCPLARVRSRDDNPPERGQRTVRFDLRRGFARPTTTLQEGLCPLARVRSRDDNPPEHADKAPTASTSGAGSRDRR